MSTADLATFMGSLTISAASVAFVPLAIWQAFERPRGAWKYWMAAAMAAAVVLANEGGEAIPAWLQSHRELLQFDDWGAPDLLLKLKCRAFAVMAGAVAAAAIFATKSR